MVGTLLLSMLAIGTGTPVHSYSETLASTISHWDTDCHTHWSWNWGIDFPNQLWTGALISTLLIPVTIPMVGHWFLSTNSVLGHWSWHGTVPQPNLHWGIDSYIGMLTPFSIQLWIETLISHWEVDLFFSLSIWTLSTTQPWIKTVIFILGLWSIHSTNRSSATLVFVLMVGTSAFLSLPTIGPHVKIQIPLWSS